LKEGRALLDFLSKSTPTEGNAYGILLSEELKSIQKKQDYYLIHEHLEDVNEPVYFHEFMERADAQGLQYLGEADYSVMMTSNFSPDVEAMVSQLARRKAQTASEDVDLIQLEQYMDFVRNRHFRQTLLCKKGIQLERPVVAERVKDMYIASPAKPETPIEDLRSHEEVLFRRVGSTLKTTTPLLKAAMLILAEQWPQSIHFSRLMSAARAKVNPSPSVIDPEAARVEEEKLTKPLLHCYATTHVDISIGQFPFSLKVPDLPIAMRLARYQASRGLPTTNLWHETVHISDIQRRILPLLDGTHDLSSITDRLSVDVSQGNLVVHDKGEPVTDAQRVREILGSLVQDNLLKLARNGLLCAGQ
jgi:methyltransferase-like protein